MTIFGLVRFVVELTLLLFVVGNRVGIQFVVGLIWLLSFGVDEFKLVPFGVDLIPFGVDKRVRIHLELT